MPVLDVSITQVFQKVTDTPVACWYVNLRMVDDSEGSMLTPFAWWLLDKEFLSRLNQGPPDAVITDFLRYKDHIIEGVDCVAVVHVRENHESAVADEAGPSPSADGAEEAGSFHGLVPFPINGEGDFFSIGPALQPMRFEERL